MNYLAFDFGDGTTCAAQYNELLAEPTIPNIIKGTNEIWSNIAFDKDGKNPIVGLTVPKRNYSLLSNWKAKPSKRDEGWQERRKIAVAYMRECFRLFLSNNPEYADGKGEWAGICNGQECRVVIGVPCDWGDADIEEYKRMAAEAGLPEVLVFKESQAAVLYARKFMASGLPDEYLENGVLMIDIGSSTTDFTYMKGLRAAHCGLALGAKFVEQAFLGEAMKRDGYEYFRKDSDPASIEQGRRLRNANLLLVREWKEMYFRMAEQTWPEVQTSPLPGASLIVGDIDDGGGYITPEFIDRCLNDSRKGVAFKLPHLSKIWETNGLSEPNSWRGHFRNALTVVQHEYGIDSRKVTICVTGGASRMQFVEEDIHAVFGGKVRCYFGNDRERSFSVVKGLAWTAYATDLIEDRKKSYPAEIESVFSQADTQLVVHDNVIQPIVDDVVAQLISNLKDEMLLHPERLNTKRKIKDFAQNQAQSILVKVSPSERIRDVMPKLLELPTIKGVFEDLQVKLGRSKIYVSMPPIEISDIQLSSISDLDLSLDSVVDGVSLAIFYGVLMYFGALGVLAALGLFIFTKLCGDALLKKGPDEEIEIEKIRKAASTIEGQTDQIKGKILEAFKQGEKGSSYVDAINASILKTILSVKDKELMAIEGLFTYEER